MTRIGHYEIAASKPSENSDYEFFTACSGAMAEKSYAPQLIEALAAEGPQHETFGPYVSLLREHTRRKVIDELAAAGSINASLSEDRSSSADALIVDVCASRLADEQRGNRDEPIHAHSKQHEERLAKAAIDDIYITWTDSDSRLTHASIEGSPPLWKAAGLRGI